MTGVRDGEQGGDAVLFRARALGYLVPGAVGPAVLFGLTLQQGVVERSWDAALMLVCSTYLLGMQLWLALRRQRWGWSVRVDAEGVTWRDSRRFVPWGLVVDLRVVPRRGPWRLLPSHPQKVLVSARYQDPRDPDAPVEPTSWAIVPWYLEAGTEDVVAALHRFCPRPVLR